MYVRVTTQEELEIFNSIWKSCWIERGYELEFSDDVLDRFIIKDGEKNAATVELVLYEKSEIKKIFNFSSYEGISLNPERVLEIGKLSIMPSSRGKKVLQNIFSLLFNYGQSNNFHYGIALIEPKLYLAMKIFYKIPVIKLGEKFYYKGDDVIPICIDIFQFIQHLEKYNWVKRNSMSLTESSLH